MYTTSEYYRKYGATKALARKKACVESSRDSIASEVYYCGACVYQEEGGEDKLWIGCDLCDKWYCGDCEKLSLPPDVDTYICTLCQQ